MRSSADMGARRLAPFAVVAVLPFFLLPLPPATWNVGELVLSACLTLIAGWLALLSATRRVPGFVQVAPALVYLAAVAAFREAGAGVSAGIGALVLLPIFWQSLYCTRREVGY